MNLKKSLELYKILEPHLPEDLELEPFDFVSKIVRNIKENEQHNDYIKAIEFISGISKDELITMEVMKLFEIFTDGMVDIQVIYLTKFCRDIGLSNAG
ncbi:MAG: hypothetical protein ACXADW_21825 [Candidatus Hodarchaeales archaeon]|jgi:hypothetical protein